MDSTFGLCLTDLNTELNSPELSATPAATTAPEVAATPIATASTVPQGVDQETPVMAFAQLQLAAPLARAVAEMGYESMTPIQAQAIPVVLSGRDVMGAAQTGTGKTAAFALPLLQRMMKHENPSTSPARHPVRALVLLPTRELADQVTQEIRRLARARLRHRIGQPAVRHAVAAQTVQCGPSHLQGVVTKHIGQQRIGLGLLPSQDPLRDRRTQMAQPGRG